MPSPTALITVSIACGIKAEADALARGLVEARLAACVQVRPIDSTYQWQGAIVTEPEFLLVAKTLERALPAIETYVTTHHSYDVPEIIAQPITWASAAYAQWMRDSIK